MPNTPCQVTRGIVLRETETKEADKILTVLSPDQGKISVIARGARRKSCRFAACAQLLAWSELTLYHRGNWYYLNEGTTLCLFDGLRRDLEKLALGAYFAELTEAVTQEEVAAPEIVSLLLNGLYALENLPRPPALIKAAFELRLMCLAGYEPLADGCAYCGAEEPEEPRLDVQQGRGRWGGSAPRHLRTPQTTLCLHPGRRGSGAALRRGGGLRADPAGAGFPNAGLLQKRQNLIPNSIF